MQYIYIWNSGGSIQDQPLVKCHGAGLELNNAANLNSFFLRFSLQLFLLGNFCFPL